jgi:small subunit ribosomal protein S17
MSTENKSARTLAGQVVSNKMHKTVVVLIVRKVKHPVYGKYIKRSKKLFAHDETNQCHEGDTVLIQECRPLSKNKSWTVKEIITKADAAE